MATDTIPAATAAANPYKAGPFRDVCEMEDPLTLIQDLLGGLILLGLALDDGGTAVSRIADIARDECAKLEELRTSIFHALHPDREAAR